MFINKKYFTHIKSWPTHLLTQHVTHLDGVSKAKIEGIDTTRFFINHNHRVEFKNFPILSSNHISLNELLWCQGCMVHGEHNTITGAFPTFITDAYFQKEITIHTKPLRSKPIFSTLHAPTHKLHLSSPNSSIIAKHNINKLHLDDTPNKLTDDPNIDLTSKD